MAIITTTNPTKSFAFPSTLMVYFHSSYSEATAGVAMFYAFKMKRVERQHKWNLEEHSFGYSENLKRF